MICSRCGKPLPEGATTCAACGAPGMAPSLSRGGVAASRPAAPAAAGGPLAYAGFWLRLVAYVIDAFVLGLVSGFAGSFVGGILGGVVSASGAPPESVAAAGGLGGGLVAFVLGWLYFAVLESSGKQATLGKMAVGLAVTDGEGRPIGFGRATGRYFAKLLSAFPILIGFLLAGFTSRKQALHDMVAGTLVVRRREGGVAVVIVAVAAVGIVGIAVVGILAAIAIPNFIRYQLRAKGGEATMQLLGIQSAEASQLARTRKYFSLELPNGGRPGPTKMAWSPGDLAAASEVGWSVAEASYFSYRVAAVETAEGQQAFSACAEADLDGDGQVAAVVLWHPALDASQKVIAPPPPPPCAHDPVLSRSPLFGPGDPVGEPVKISPASVF
ncbi:MAG TPA: RDD family protein [Anaeromyxobacter sp.]